MKPLSIKHLSVLLAVALLLCHGLFGTLHLVCYLPQCANRGEHAERSIRPRLAGWETLTSIPRVMGQAPGTSPCSSAYSACS